MGQGQDNRIVHMSLPQEQKDTPYEHTLDPSGALTIRLASSFIQQQQESRVYPPGFWDHFNRAGYNYSDGQYQNAKEDYIAARNLLSDYASLTVGLLRTYRKLYKVAIENKRWDDAYREISELFRTLPDEVTDMDRKQFYMVIRTLKKKDPGFQGMPLPVQKRQTAKREKPMAEVESSSGVEITVQQSDTGERHKNEWSAGGWSRQITPEGYLTVKQIYDEEYGGYKSCQIRTYFRDGDIISESEWPVSFCQLKICPTGKRLIGCTQDLVLSLWNLNGERLVERSIKRETEGEKWHVRCVDISEDGRYCLFADLNKIYLLDQNLRKLRIWKLPLSEGEWMEREVQDAGKERIEEALTTLGLAGGPTQEEIRTQFRRLVIEHHPDRNPGDALALDRTRRIIEAYRAVSDVDVLEALEGSGVGERYYKTLYEQILNIGDTGLSMKLSVSIRKQGNSISASYISPCAERIYLCGSHCIYCADVNGRVSKIYLADAMIIEILERKGYLYIRNRTGLQVLQYDRGLNHIELRGGEHVSFTDWGIVVKNGPSLVLYSDRGDRIGTINFPKEPQSVIPTSTGLLAYVAMELFRVSLSSRTEALKAT